MKTTRKIWVTAVAILTAVFLVGCGDLTGVQVGESATAKVTMNAKVIGNGIVLPGMANSSRTILPAKNPGATTAGRYFLYGKSIKDKELDDGVNRKLAVDGNDFTFTVSINADVWDFILFYLEGDGTSTGVSDAAAKAYKEADILENALYVGYANVDLTSNSNDVVFNLSTKGIKKPGSVELTVVLKNNETETTPWSQSLSVAPFNEGRAVMEIRDLISGEVINDVNDSPVTDNPTFTGGEATFASADDIMPGTYNFAVRFETKDGGNYVELGEWSDIIVILPGRKTEATVYVPRIIDSAPVKPESLTACYYAKSEDNPREGFYKVHFQWDASNTVNEKYFELQIIPINGTADGEIPTTTPATAVTYTQDSALLNEGTVKKFISAEERFDGSLFANNTDCTVYLKLGQEYQARIRAKNAVGASDWVNVDLPTTKPTIDGVAASDISLFDSIVGTKKIINRYRVTYNLNGGRYSPKASVIKSSDKVVYSEVKATPYTYWTGAGVGHESTDHSGYTPEQVLADAVCLKKGTAPVNGWTLLAGGADADSYKIAKIVKWALDTAGGVTGMLEPTATPSAANKPSGFDSFGTTGYTGYENITLYAMYGSSTYSVNGTIKIDDPATIQLLPKDIAYEGSKTDGTAGATPVSGVCAASATSTETSGAITVSKQINHSGSETIKFTVNVPKEGEGGIKYDDLYLEVKDSTGSYVAAPQKITGPAVSTSAVGTKAFTAIDISNLDNGAYSVIITAKQTTSGNTITRRVNITMTVTD